MSDWYIEAQRLKAEEGKSLSEIANILNMSYKTVESRFYRDKVRVSPPAVNSTEDLQSSILKDIQKECAISYLCDKYKKTPRIIQATLEDIKDTGYMLTEIGDTVKLCKSIIPTDNKYEEEWTGQRIIKFGVTSDNHLCNKWQQLTFLNHLYDVFEREGIETVYNGGDISDGYYKERPGHIYELQPGLIGADAQTDYIVNKYPYRKGITTKFITGNHDHTHIKNGGTDIGKQIAKDRADMIYLGQSNALVNVTPNCPVEINHPGDGASYALSYAIQKYIDSMTGGEKPHVLLNAHHHKAMYLPVYRNIHSFETATTCAQTPWMKSKRIAAMMGGWIVTLSVDREGTIEELDNKFIALYKPIENDY